MRAGRRLLGVESRRQRHWHARKGRQLDELLRIAGAKSCLGDERDSETWGNRELKAVRTGYVSPLFGAENRQTDRHRKQD